VEAVTKYPADPALSRAVRAVYVAFIGSGFAFASWAARIPQVRDRLHATPGQLGLILLCIAIGSIVALPMSGIVVGHFGEARTVSTMSVVLCAGLGLAGVGYLVGPVPVCIGLFLVGFGNGAWDVAMNVQGASVERELGRSIMSRFHAGWSIGTVAGAAIGAAMIALHVPVAAHLVAAAVIVAVAVPLSTMRGFLPSSHHQEPHASRRAAVAAWREPRTLLIGLFVLCLAFTEGTGNDWIGVAMIDGYHSSATTGSIALAVFLAAMTTGRWFGPSILDRRGRVPVLRVSAVIAIAGLALVVFAQNIVVAFVGVVAWGLGTSLGFPTGMSAAADDPTRAAARVSVAASIAYTAFLAGPPLVGLVGDHIGVLRGLVLAIVLLAVALGLCQACAPLPSESQEKALADR
jgi:predicted MFS family arabinose efflux permease